MKSATCNTCIELANSLSRRIEECIKMQARMRLVKAENEVLKGYIKLMSNKYIDSMEKSCAAIDSAQVVLDKEFMRLVDRD